MQMFHEHLNLGETINTKKHFCSFCTLPADINDFKCHGDQNSGSLEYCYLMPILYKQNIYYHQVQSVMFINQTILSTN